MGKQHRDGTPRGEVTRQIIQEVAVQIKSLGVQSGDIIVARVSEAVTHGKMEMAATRIRKAINALKIENVVLLIMPSDIDVHRLPREVAIQALETILQATAGVEEKDQALSVLTGQAAKFEYRPDKERKNQ